MKLFFILIVTFLFIGCAPDTGEQTPAGKLNVPPKKDSTRKLSPKPSDKLSPINEADEGAESEEKIAEMDAEEKEPEEVASQPEPEVKTGEEVVDADEQVVLTEESEVKTDEEVAVIGEQEVKIDEEKVAVTEELEVKTSEKVAVIKEPEVKMDEEKVAVIGEQEVKIDEGKVAVIGEQEAKIDEGVAVTDKQELEMGEEAVAKMAADEQEVKIGDQASEEELAQEEKNWLDKVGDFWDSLVGDVFSSSESSTSSDEYTDSSSEENSLSLPSAVEDVELNTADNVDNAYFVSDEGLIFLGIQDVLSDGREVFLLVENEEVTDTVIPLSLLNEIPPPIMSLSDQLHFIKNIGRIQRTGQGWAVCRGQGYLIFPDNDGNFRHHSSNEPVIKSTYVIKDIQRNQDEKVEQVILTKVKDSNSSYRDTGLLNEQYILHREEKESEFFIESSDIENYILTLDIFVGNDRCL